MVAGLSLHYFSEENTERIVKEIKRIVRPQGMLLARVNSSKDVVHGAGDGVQIEQNFYIDNKRGNNKRFFIASDVERFFSPFGKMQYKEVVGKFNDTEKIMFEIVAVSDKQIIAEHEKEG